MSSAGEQLLGNPDIEPSDGVIAKALGKSHKAYVRFLNAVKKRGIYPEWRYYNDAKEWLAKGLFRRTGARGGQIEKTIFWLSIRSGLFRVSFYIPEKNRAEVLRLPFDTKVKKMISASRQMGKLKFFPVIFELCSDGMFEAVLLLVDFRKNMA